MFDLTMGSLGLIALAALFVYPPASVIFFALWGVMLCLIPIRWAIYGYGR